MNSLQTSKEYGTEQHPNKELRDTMLYIYDQIQAGIVNSGTAPPSLDP